MRNRKHDVVTGPISVTYTKWETIISKRKNRGGLIYWLRSQSIDRQKKLPKVIGNQIAKKMEDDEV